MPAGVAMPPIEAAYAVPSTLARRTVTAWFENETMDEIVATICQAVGASCTVGSTIEVAP